MFALSVSIGVLIAARNYAIVGALIFLAASFVLFESFSERQSTHIEEVPRTELVRSSIGIIIMALLLGLVWPAALVIVATGRGVEKRKSKSGVDAGRPVDRQDPSS